MFNSVQFVKLFIVSLFLITLIDNSSQQECNAALNRKIDEVMARLLTIGNSGRKFPESKGEDLKKYCDDSKAYIKQIEDYKNKCLKDLPKQYTSVIIYSVKNTIDQLCKRDSKRLTEVISATPCMNTAATDIHKCYTKYVDALLGAKNTDDSKKIPHNCCEYYKIISCSENRMRKIKGCSGNQIEIGMNFVRSLFGNVLDLVCNDYTEGSDKCDKLEPVPKKKRNQRRTKSFLIPLVDLFSSFSEV